MNATRETAVPRHWPDAVRWGACFALALGIHVGGAAALLARWSDDADSVANAPVIMIELAPVPVAPETKQTELPPGPQQSQAQPEPEPPKPIEKTVELPPEPQAEPLQAVLPPPKPIEKPVEKKQKQKHASLPSAPSAAEKKAERAAAPAPGAASHNPNAVPNWKSALVARLERYKRYPSKRSRAASKAWRSSLSASTAAAACMTPASCVARARACSTRRRWRWLERAAPLPPPPPEIAGAQIAITVPIRYNMR